MKILLKLHNNIKNYKLKQKYIVVNRKLDLQIQYLEVIIKVKKYYNLNLKQYNINLKREINNKVHYLKVF